MALRPRVEFLDEDLLTRIVDEAHRVLEEIGIAFSNEDARARLQAYGARPSGDGTRICLPEAMVRRAIAATPSAFTMYDRFGDAAMVFEDDRIHFVPGSAACFLLDSETGEARRARTADLIRFIRVSQALPAIDGLATGLVSSDVPEAVSDAYRLYLCLRHGSKPVVTGAFSAEGIRPMIAMLEAVRGSKAALEAKPLAWFSCCPTSPLKFSDATSQNVIDCALAGIPIETIAMPLTGFIAPVSLVGALIQHTAESLSGLALAQAAREGSPLLYGGSPAAFDVRFETTPMGAVETQMIDCAYAQIGKHLGLPTQAYMALSDAKCLDAQAGFETAMGATLAALGGINSISGPGLIDYENVQSIEKLVLDNEICAMVKRMVRGIEARDDFPSLDRFRDLLSEGHCLISDHTMRWLGEEHYYPGPVVERAVRRRWKEEGASTLEERARREVDRILATEPLPPPENVEALDEVMLRALRDAGMKEFPS